MLRDLRIFRRSSNAGKNNENLPADPSDSSACAPESDPSRPPLHAIQESAQNPKLGPDQGTFLRRKPEAAATTPSRNQGKGLDSTHLPFRTPENRRRFGWATKGEQGGTEGDNGEDCGHHGASGQLPPLSRGGSLNVGAGYGTSTPRTYRPGGKASSAHSDSSSTQSTPTKSVSKPSYPGFSSSSRPTVGLSSRAASFNMASRGIPGSAAIPTVYNLAEVPHFELKEDPSFWMDNNVQVVIRIRPINSTERNLQGFHRCLKQESAQSITWIGQPETKFAFDYVACEAINQETLFRVAGLPMVENCMSGYNSCVFAYGQTGSGKTYTMLGEIGELETRPSLDRGMTPRIFEFLFARIRAEEESRRDEKLRYNCKCSFLEIYNEQITDLLDPSSSNLLLREDIRKGVYVENLTEYVVENVGDILKLLILGASNRKVAATNMNRESSRSHSVFTCVIESRWEKDSSMNLRFARLNLVDLAGSERQKTSGAEGERLKEAANINKSLSTLGHVIMLLADVANGKQRHVPYRDSRLTFLLQDSLGGNSKTMIIANVSPSICSANETLSTLRFAQRARLIQNNAIINEDACGDVIALQHQIRLLKEELSLLKRQNVSRSLSFRTTIFEDSDHESDISMMEKSSQATEESGDTLPDGEASGNVRVSLKQLKSLEAILAGALRREKMADNTIKQLEAEIEQLNRLVRQREEDTRCSKMMLKFREDKIQRMEKVVNSQLPADSFLIEEKNALTEEVQLLCGRLDRNPEVTRFALENIRLLDQIRRFQDFYEEGERELLLTEISDLRNKLQETIAGKSEVNQTQDNCKNCCFAGDNESLTKELKKTSQELENCRKELKSCLDINERLTREVSNLQNELNSIRSTSHVNVDCRNNEVFPDSFQSDTKANKQGEPLHEDKIKHAEELLNLQLELDILKTILAEEKSCRTVTEERSICAYNDLRTADTRVLHLTKQNEDMNNELMEARSIIEALETEHIQLIEEIEELKKQSNYYVDLVKKQEQEQEIFILKDQHVADFSATEGPSFGKEIKDQHHRHYENEDSHLQVKLRKMQASLDKARDLNMRFQCDQFSQSSLEQEMDEVRRQVEVETAEVIVCLQDELAALQKRADDSNRSESIAKQHVMELKTQLKELQEMLSLTTQENRKLGELVEVKNRDLKELTEDWEKLAYEIADILAEGNTALEEASDQVAFISDSFEQRSWIGGQVERMIKSLAEKDLVIEELHKCLEEAQTARCDMEWKLRSLRGATLAITEAQQQESNEREREIFRLTSELTEKTLTINELEKTIKLHREQAEETEMRTTVAFITLNRLSELNTVNCYELELLKLLLDESKEMISQKDALLLHQISSYADAEKGIESLNLQLRQSQEVISVFQNLSQQQKDKEEFERSQKEHYDITLSNIAEELQTANGIINEFKVGMHSLNSCIKNPVAQFNEIVEAQISGKISVECADYILEDRFEINPVQDYMDNDQDVAYTRVVTMETECIPDNEESSICPKMQNGLLVKKELDSFLVSLQGLKHEMSQLLNQKEEHVKAEILNQANIEQLTGEVLRLETDIVEKEKLFDLKLLHMTNRLQEVMEMAAKAIECLCKRKRSLEIEVVEAKALATQKTIEATTLLTKFEEAQATMRDADIMVNVLMQANETAKVDIERLQNNASSLSYEREFLINNIKDMQLSLDRKEEEYLSLVNNFNANIIEVKSLVVGLEDTYRHLQNTFTDKFESFTCDLEWLKARIQKYAESIRIGLEETWSEIIGKDCAVSVLHLCHMGILIERITGLNVENGFLQNGLSISNTVIADLTEHNARAEKELEMCSILKGKLLVDINNSFHRIARKEDETVEFRSKLNSFEKKISHLQLQEESMLARSNSMGNELAVLVREMEASNKNALTAVLFQEELLREKEELIKELEDISKLWNEVMTVNEMFMHSPSDLETFVDNPCDRFPLETNTPRASSIDFLNESKQHKNNMKVQIESIITKLFAKDIELLVMTSERELVMNQSSQMISMMADMERQRYTSRSIIEKIEMDMIVSKIDVEIQDEEIHFLLKENEELRKFVQMLKEENVKVTGELEITKKHNISSASQLDSVSQESHMLRERICSLESSVACVQYELDRKNTELEEMLHSHALITKELNLKSEISEIQNERTHALISEMDSLKDKLRIVMANKDEALILFGHGLKHECDLIQSMDLAANKLFGDISDQLVSLTQRIDQESSENENMLSKVFHVLDCMELSVKKLVLDVSSLHSEVMHKDDMVKGLLFDLSLLQESASVAKDEKEKLRHMVAILESLEDELASRSSELDEAIARGDILESELLEKSNKISSLELALEEKSDILKLVSVENHEIKTRLNQIIELKTSVEEELNGKTLIIERLEEELLGTSALLGQREHCVEDLHKDIAKVTRERDNISSELLIFKEKLEMAQALAEENEAIATEARQIAQVKHAYAEEKEEEVKLLEKSIEELECTVYAMENKVDILKAEAERQRLQREELEMELHAVQHQMLALPSSGTIMSTKGQTELSRHFSEKMADFEVTQKNFQVLQKEITEKNLEIIQLKAHISELNLHAEAQAIEYKQKFKELEIMAQQVKSDPASFNTMNLASAKPDKCVVKSKGSGSPFKCIGMGFVHQVNSEKEEDLVAAKHQIEELESLAASRQKEIFMLKSRLAAAESMTHDVIRDLLGVKLDMTNYASLLDNHQTPKVKEPDQVNDLMSQEREEVSSLKKQVNEFIEERQSWLDELVAAQIAVEKIRQREQVLSTENGMLKAENTNFKRTIVELEVEVKKLSSQQNLQQRIHHHAKIKEENTFLKTQNEELNLKLKRYEEILARVKQELAQYRSSCGKNPYINFDEEEELKKRLQDSDEERIQLSRKLLELCGYILKVAGLAESTSDINLSAAEEAVCQLKNRISSLENELQEFKLKCKILHEKLRLHEIGQQYSPFKHQYSPQHLMVR